MRSRTRRAVLKFCHLIPFESGGGRRVSVSYCYWAVAHPPVPLLKKRNHHPCLPLQKHCPWPSSDTSLQQNTLCKFCQARPAFHGSPTTISQHLKCQHPQVAHCVVTHSREEVINRVNDRFSVVLFKLHAYINNQPGTNLRKMFFASRKILEQASFA